MPIRAYRPLVFDRSGTPAELPSPDRPVRSVLLRNPRAAGEQKESHESEGRKQVEASSRLQHDATERIGATAKPELAGPLVNEVLGKVALGVFLELTTRAQC